MSDSTPAEFYTAIKLLLAQQQNHIKQRYVLFTSRPWACKYDPFFPILSLNNLPTNTAISQDSPCAFFYSPKVALNPLADIMLMSIILNTWREGVEAY